MQRTRVSAVLFLLAALSLPAAPGLRAQDAPPIPVQPATAPDDIDPFAVPPDIRAPTPAETALLQDARQRASDMERRELAPRDAIPTLRSALALSEATCGPRHPFTALLLSALADALYRDGQELEAEPLHRRGQAIFQERFGEAHARARGRQWWLVDRLVKQHRHAEAEPLQRRLVDVTQAALGPDSFEVAVNLGGLADILRATGRTGEAVPLLRRAYDITAGEVGADHLMAITAYNNWVGAVEEQGDAAQAEALYRRHLAEREASLGADHVEVARTVVALATFLEAQRHETEAEALYRRALRIRQHELGDSDPMTTQVLYALANLADTQGRYADAEALFRRVLAGDEEHFGADHPEVATDLDAVAGALERQGRHAEAETLRRRALSIFESGYGPDHVRTTRALGDLAANLGAQSRHTEAEKVARRMLDARQRSLGAGHADTAWAMDIVARALEGQGRNEEARALYERALSVSGKALGADAPTTLSVAADLADLYYGWDRLSEAEAGYRRVLDARRRQLDAAHPDVGAAMASLAEVLDAQGRYAEAEPLYRQSLALREARLGADHVDTATAVFDLARVLNSLGRHAEAAQLDRRALAVREARLGGDDPDTIASLGNLASDLTELGHRQDMDEAGVLYRRALAAGERRFGRDSADTAVHLNNLGWFHNLADRPADADPLLRRALAIWERHSGRDSLDAATALKNLGLSLDLQDRHAEAEALHRRALAIRELRLGTQHPLLAPVLGHLSASLQAQGRTVEAEREARRAVGIARAQREREGARADALASARAFGDASDPLQAAYRDYLAIAWRAGVENAGEAEPLRDRAFAAAQDLDVSGAARALAQAAARIAGGDCAPDVGADCLAALARHQQDLAAQLRDFDRALLAATGKGDAAAAARLRRQVADVGRELQAVAAQLRERFPDYATMVSPRALDAAQVRSRLGDDEGLLLVMPAAADVFVFGVGKQGASWHRLEGGAARVAARVARLRCQADPATCGGDAGAVTRGVASVFGQATAQGQRPFDRDAAHALYRELVAPVEAAFAGAQRLYVVASGPLGGLPLGVLVTEAPKAGEDDADPDVLARTAWLADRYALTTLPAVSSLRTSPREATAAAGGRAFVGFGDPVLLGGAGTTRGVAGVADSDEPPRWFRSADAQGLALADPATLRTLAPLPGTRVELAAMAQALGATGDALELGEAATEGAVKSDPRLRDARVVAFATHGLLPGEVKGLDEPGLVFTPPQAASGDDDGVLAASEAATLQLRADWLILSACNTAAPDGSSGGGSLSGLARAFLYAGAQSLLVSHWRVRDDVTAALTVQTLRDRLDGGHTRAQSLQRAMRAVRTGMLTDGTPLQGWQAGWTHPSAWAPFVVVSDQDR